jgi:glycerol-1-phosphate dehydrogenase [NAD(P)+]
MYFEGWQLTPDDVGRLREQIRPLIGDMAADSIGLGWVIIARDAIARLPALLVELCGSSRPEALLVMDDTPMRRGDDDLKRYALAQLHAGNVRVETLALRAEHGKVYADERNVARVAEALRPGVAAVALGSGTITDIVKHGSYRWTLEHPNEQAGPLVVVPTAASVAAYAINLAVILADGVKRTWPSRWPTAVVADIDALRAAPHKLTAAGFADIIPPRFVAVSDWYLSDSLAMSEGFPPALVAALEDCDRLLGPGAAAVGRASEESLAHLMGAIVLVGVLVGPTGQSTLLSGWEHVVSHVLDMTAAHQGRAVALHGAQVGVASLLSALAYARMFERLRSEPVDLARCFPRPEAMRAAIKAAFAPVDPSGRMAAECWRDYAIKLERWRGRREQVGAWLRGWPDSEAARALRAYTATPQQVAAALRDARAPMLPEQLDPPISTEQLRFALLHAHLIRRRFTIGDLLFFLGWLDGDFIDSLLAEARALAGG